MPFFKSLYSIIDGRFKYMRYVKSVWRNLNAILEEIVSLQSGRTPSRI